MNKKWMDYTVGTLLVLLLVVGLTLIIRTVNSDLQIPDLDNALAERGLELAKSNGCVACHSLDGGVGIGPTWLGMYGKTETLVDGSTVVVDEDYIIESILRPDAKQVEGYEKVMVRSFLSGEELQALVEFTRQLAEQGP
ncbi:MAG: cytochrome c oxidase subunit 2 [Pseudohongiellaceae bacterium]|jgi:cytochrome c oxidase subunit 2|tara:strand:- start:415 stop:831 length:417 start_codon:yes stop_codon:yes gene_type:complete